MSRRWGRMEEEIKGVRILDKGWERERERERVRERKVQKERDGERR